MKALTTALPLVLAALLGLSTASLPAAPEYTVGMMYRVRHVELGRTTLKVGNTRTAVQLELGRPLSGDRLTPNIWI